MAALAAYREFQRGLVSGTGVENGILHSLGQTHETTEAQYEKFTRPARPYRTEPGCPVDENFLRFPSPQPKIPGDVKSSGQ